MGSNPIRGAILGERTMLTEHELMHAIADIAMEIGPYTTTSIMAILEERYSGQYDVKLATELAARLGG